MSEDQTWPTEPCLCWHAYHDHLLYPLADGIRDRVQTIQALKPSHEVPTRLRLIKKVKGPVPLEIWKAARKYFAATRKMRKLQERARKLEKREDQTPTGDKVYRKLGMQTHETEMLSHHVMGMLRRYEAQLEELHAKECPNCPWNGQTIFPSYRY